jgi:hypothetical protein
MEFGPSIAAGLSHFIIAGPGELDIVAFEDRSRLTPPIRNHIIAHFATGFSTACLCVDDYPASITFSELSPCGNCLRGQPCDVVKRSTGGVTFGAGKYFGSLPPGNPALLHVDLAVRSRSMGASARLILSQRDLYRAWTGLCGQN